MKTKFIDYYDLASKLIFITFVMGIAIIFIRGLEEVADLIIAALVLALRWVSVILIKRRFTFSKYLLIILIARNIYRLLHVNTDTKMNTLAIYLIIIQIILTALAFILINKAAQRIIDNIRKKIQNPMGEKPGNSEFDNDSKRAV